MIAVAEQQLVEPAARREREIEPEVGETPVGDGALRQVVRDRVVPELLGRLDLDGHPPVAHADFLQCQRRSRMPIAATTSDPRRPCGIVLRTGPPDLRPDAYSLAIIRAMRSTRSVRAASKSSNDMRLSSNASWSSRRRSTSSSALDPSVSTTGPAGSALGARVAARALRVRLGRLGHLAVSFSECAAALGQDELLRRAEGEFAHPKL